MSEPSDTKHNSAAAIPYAILVPVLVVMAQSAWVQVTGGDFRLNGLLPEMFHPICLIGMIVVAVISFFVIRPFVMRAIQRWIAFFLCVVGFTALIEFLLFPGLAE